MAENNDSRMVSNLTATCDYKAMKNADVVIEAVFEDLPLKHKVVKQIEGIVGKVSLRQPLWWQKISFH